jgi:hypothetical protein
VHVRGANTRRPSGNITRIKLGIKKRRVGKRVRDFGYPLLRRLKHTMWRCDLKTREVSERRLICGDLGETRIENSRVRSFRVRWPSRSHALFALCLSLKSSYLVVTSFNWEVLSVRYSHQNQMTRQYMCMDGSNRCDSKRGSRSPWFTTVQHRRVFKRFFKTRHKQRCQYAHLIVIEHRHIFSISLTNGASVRLTGALTPSPGPGQSRELVVEAMEILGACDPEVHRTPT